MRWYHTLPQIPTIQLGLGYWFILATLSNRDSKDAIQIPSHVWECGTGSLIVSVLLKSHGLLAPVLLFSVGKWN